MSGSTHCRELDQACEVHRRNVRRNTHQKAFRDSKNKKATDFPVAFVNPNFRSCDNPNTICQNLPETALTSAGAEEGQREKLETCIPAARESLEMHCVA